MQLIQNHIEVLKKQCEAHHVAKLYVFGSYVRNEQTEDSDLDLLVDFQDEIELLNFADNYFSFLDDLQDLFRVRVDLVIQSSLKNPVLIDSINHTKKLIYESERTKVSA